MMPLPQKHQRNRQGRKEGWIVPAFFHFSRNQKICPQSNGQRSFISNNEAELKKAVDFVKKYPNSQVKIEGHTDSTASDAYNQKLSERRAKAVANYLVDKGACKQADISTAGFGESKPIADNKTATGRFENRRAEILILEK